MQPYLPAGVSLPYSNLTMLDIQSWVSQKAERIMFTYGEFDPWSARMFDPIKENADNHRYVVEHGNHGSTFWDLPNDSRDEAIQVLSRWFGKSPNLSINKSMNREKTLEELEYKIRRKLKL